MVGLIRAFGQWLKQGFGWLIDVFVAACAWGITQVGRLFGTHLTIAPTIPDLIALLIVVVIVLLVVWLLAGLWRQIRLALGIVVDAIGTLFMALAVVAGAFAGVGAVCFVLLWVMSHTNVASLRF